MTDVSNLLLPFYLGNASQNDDSTTPVGTGKDTDVTWWAPADHHYSSRGYEARRQFNTVQYDDVNVSGGFIAFSQYVDVPAAITVDTALWDIGSVGSGTNTAYGGYGAQIGSSRTFDFMWRDEGVAGAATKLLSVDIDSPDIWYMPSGTKYGTVFHFGIAIISMIMPSSISSVPIRKRFATAYIDGNPVESQLLPDGENAAINPEAGITLWGTSFKPSETVCGNVMNATDTGFRTSSFFTQRIVNRDESDKPAKIMADAMMLRQAQPASSIGL